MKLKKSLRTIFILNIFIIVMFTSCDILDNLKSNQTSESDSLSDNDSLEEQIIGKWTYKTETSKKSVYLISSFEFRKDGSVSFSIDTTEAEGVITNINYEISGNTLTLVYLDGKTTEVYENVSVFGNVLYIMGDDKPFIRDNSENKTDTTTTNKQKNIISKDDITTTTIPTTELIIEPSTEPTTINTLILKKGDKGNDVKDLQSKLRDIGLYTGSIDGIFGSITESCVKELQKKYNLTQDGIVKGETWVALEKALNPITTETPTQTEQKIIPKTSTDNSTSKNNFKLYEPKEYGVVDYGASFGVKERVVSTSNLKAYGYLDVNTDSLILYDTALKLNGFIGGLDDVSISDVLYNEYIVSYTKEYGDKEIHVMLTRDTTFGFTVLFSLGEPRQKPVDFKSQIEISDLRISKTGEKDAYKEYWISAKIKNNSDVALSITFSVDIFENGKKITDVLIIEEVPAGETKEKTVYNMDLKKRTYDDELKINEEKFYVREP